MTPGRLPSGGAVLLIATLWTWGVTGAAGWRTALDHGAVLPLLPTLLWCLPGLLWRHLPLAALAALAAATLLAARWRGQGGGGRLAVLAALALVIAVACVWGGALSSLSRDVAAGR